jgi:rubrerythrin
VRVILMNGVESEALRFQLAENTAAVEAAPDGAAGIAALRAELSRESPPVGTMPVPGNLKGAAKTAVKALQGKKARVFLDKLGERLAFERSGVRLYDALLAKVPAAKTREGSLTEGELRRFRDEELAHMHLVKDAIEHLGGDPTAVTPSADLKGVESMGLVQVLTDPRTTLTQGLEVILTAELADNEGWKVLIAMAEAMDQDDLARRFTTALSEEDEHLRSVRTWLAERLEIQLGEELPSTDFGEPAQPA